jgi:hypothetical protein
MDKEIFKKYALEDIENLRMNIEDQKHLVDYEKRKIIAAETATERHSAIIKDAQEKIDYLYKIIDLIDKEQE